MSQTIPQYTVPSENDIVITEGILYYNYGEGSQAVAGATQGGGQFIIERDVREVPVDGAVGPIKGMRRKVRIMARFTVNMLKINKDQMEKFYAGMTNTDNTTYFTTTEDIDIDDGDYLTNILFAGQTQDGKYVRIKITNPLGDGNTDFANLFNKEEVVPSVQWTAHYDSSSMDTVPWSIDWEV